ncbi:MAG: hypothetical protein KJ736_01485 [Candidatus Omnitrophica bacterium]|nr:hypothetical protein [Candidatus Omnitrophota bacterium]
MKKIFIFFTILLLSFSTFAQNEVFIEKATGELCVRVMDDIFVEIVRLKIKHEELEGFTENNVSMNDYGFKAIQYEYNYKNRKNSFGVTIVGLNDEHFKKSQGNIFELKFPILGVKVQGYQNYIPKGKRFDIKAVTDVFGELLRERQTKYLPFQLTVEAEKKVFKTREDIVFKVTLKNTTNKIMVVKDLSQETLFFVYNNKEWGASEIDRATYNKVKKITLREGESIEKRFMSNGYSFPREFNVFCSYVMSYKGVRPSTIMSIIVSDD